MFPRLVAALVFFSALALAVATRAPPPPPPPPITVPPDLATFGGRAALDHQGQPAASMPGDEKVAVTK